MKKMLLFFLLAGLSLIFLLSSCEKKPTAHEHTPILHEAVSPTCGREGNTAFYECTSCGAYFLDGEALSEITDKQSVILPALAHPTRYEYDENGHRLVVTCEHTDVIYETEKHKDAGDSLCLCGHQIGTEGLLYTKNIYGYGYLLAGVGTAKTQHIVASDVYKGEPVVGVAAFAFENDQNIRSILLPDTVTLIDSDAFLNCTKLFRVTARSESLEIGQLTFKGCVNLTVLDLPDEITCIGADAFTDSGYMNSESNWEEGALYIGSSLIKADPEITGLFTVRDGTRLIADDAFRGCKDVTRVVLPDSLERIGGYAFFECSSLASIRVGDGIRHIGREAFWGTNYYNTSSNWKYDFLYLDNYLIGANTRLKTVTVKDGTLCMADGVFFDCRSITTVVLPDSLVGIGAAFEYCQSLKSVTLGEGIAHIGDYAFYNCVNLSSITLPSGLARIGTHAFYGCERLTSINLPDGIQRIEGYAFYGCKRLKTVTLPSELIFIDECAFSWCEDLATANLPDSLRYIGTFAFQGCSSLASVTVPASAVNIGYGAFNRCTSLRTVLLPEGLTELGANAFGECTALTRITLPSSLNTVSQYLFFECTALEEITLGAAIKKLDMQCFGGCTSLQTILYDGTGEDWGYIAKEYKWREGTSAFTVYCADGTLTLK